MSSKVLASALAVVSVALVSLGGVVGYTTSSSTKVTNTIVQKSVAPTEKVYIRNLSPRYYSDAEILNAIPAWDKAINVDFAQYWHTPHFKFIFIGRKKAPLGEIVATFVKSGPVDGALAYHDVENGAPAITVYSGTAAYYGYDNSVSFMHEIQELAADPTICITNQGWPYDWVYLVGAGGIDRQPQAEGTIWAQEVSDPVEAYSYPRKGANGQPVQISDFITPNWFNDGIGGRYDFMQVTTQPFMVMPGGYAQYWTGIGWAAILNFRKGHASDRGFFRGEQLEKK